MASFGGFAELRVVQDELAYVLDEVRRDIGLLHLAHQVDLLFLGGVSFLFGDHTGRDHPPQHQTASVSGRFGVVVGVEVVGGGNDAHEQRRFGQVEFRRVLAEIVLRRSLSSVRTVTEVDDVEVPLKDRVF